MENGNLRTAGNPSYVPARNTGSVLAAGGSQGRIEEYDWDGNRVWYMDVFDGFVDDGAGSFVNDVTLETYRMHHDYQRIYNATLDEWTYMVLIWVVKGEADADNMGVDPALNRLSRADADEGTWSPCALIEIRPDYAGGVGGDILWYWTFADHMVTTDPGGTAATADWVDWSGRTSRPPLVVSNTTGATDSIQAHPELLDVNGMHYTVPDGPRTDYQHCNSFDYDENTGYVAINAKASNEFFVLDHDGTFDENATPNDWDSVGALARTDAGDFLYRWGNPGNYYSGKPAGFFDEGDMEMYGTRSEQLGEIAVTIRSHALLNDNALMQQPMTIEDHQNSRIISDPLHLFDCCLESDGGAAVIVSSAEQARDQRQTPVYIMGAAEGHPDSPSTITQRDELTRLIWPAPMPTVRVARKTMVNGVPSDTPGTAISIAETARAIGMSGSIT